MRLRLAAAIAAFLFAGPLSAQTVATPDYTAAIPSPGRWTYAVSADGSEASFVDNAGRAQIWLHCARASRTVTIARPANAAAAFLSVWTSSATRNVPASFNPATSRLSASLSAYDSLLDALAMSRGRIAIGVGSTPALVAPAWPEIAHPVEDCRV